jgi:hypothetical protein
MQKRAVAWASVMAVLMCFVYPQESIAEQGKYGDPGDDPTNGPTVVSESAGVEALAVGPNAVNNGGFETNGGANTSVLDGWTIVTDNCDTTGAWYAQTGTTSSVSAHTVAAPPLGSFAAMSDQTGPGTRVLYQDISVPTGHLVAISFQLYLLNSAGDWVTPATQSLDTCNEFQNQQFRADIISTASDPLTEIGGGVLMTLWQTASGDPLESGYMTVVADLSSLRGQTVRLRFVDADNQLFLNAGVDDVVVATGVPDLGAYGLGILALLLAAVGASFLIRRRARAA